MKNPEEYEEKQYWLVIITALWFAWTKLLTPSVKKQFPKWILLLRCLGGSVTKIMLWSLIILLQYECFFFV